ncbi:MAG: hypothetical protein MUC87_12410 [Bacteroidia bacterium]|jgi:hypothetical protein|nr:hypothetical protein [Bacteroidia bacterium]
MKKLVVLFVGIFLFTLTANAQVTKAQIEAAFTELGASIADVDELYIGNTITFYTDGSHSRSSSKYKKFPKEGTKNSFALTDNSIKMTYYVSDKAEEVHLFPYKSISQFQLARVNGMIYMNIYLHD